MSENETSNVENVEPVAAPPEEVVAPQPADEIAMSMRGLRGRRNAINWLRDEPVVEVAPSEDPAAVVEEPVAAEPVEFQPELAIPDIVEDVDLDAEAAAIAALVPRVRPTPLRTVMLEEDKFGFIHDVGNASHMPLLFLALEATAKLKPNRVAEMGMGHGSTPRLHEYCLANKRQLYSFENNKEWAEKFVLLESNMHRMKCEPWESASVHRTTWGVVLVDHAPAKRRHIDIDELKNRAHVIIIHDTEQSSNEHYMLDKIWSKFKYRVDIQVEAPYASASAVSNSIDVTKWDRTAFEGYEGMVEAVLP